MTLALTPNARQQFCDNAGVPLSGGKLFTYAAGTTIKQTTWKDSAGASANTNPIILNSRGEAQVFLDPTLSYKFVLAPSTDTDPPASPIWTQDNVGDPTWATLAATGGAALIGTSDGSTVQGSLNGKASLTARNAFTLTPTGSLPSFPANLFYGEALNVYASSDNAVSTTTPGTQIPSLVNVEHYFGGSTINDGRNAVGAHLHMTAATNAANTYRFYAAGNFLADSSVNDGGSSGTKQGYLYGVGGVALLKTGATFWRSAIAGDFEVCIQTGADAQIVAGVAALQWPAHATQGSLVDCAYWASAASSAVGASNAIQIDDSAGKYPVTTTGTIIKSSGGTVANGIDFSGTTINSYLLKGMGSVLLTTTANPVGQFGGGLQVPNGGISIGGNFVFGGVEMATSKTVTAPTTGSTVTIGASTSRTIINPAGTLANLTVALPTALADGDLRHITFTKAITTLAWTGTTSGFPTTMAANSRISAIWDTATSTWFLA